MSSTDKFLDFWRKFVPKPIFNFFAPAYHYTLAIAGALIYLFPSRQVKVLAVTGTKGKTTVAELLNFVLNETGHTSAVSSTLRSERSTPGRFATQAFLRRAVLKGCEYAVVEVTSQAVLQYRHKFIKLEGLIFTGIHPEHIEAHGSFDKYLAAKLEIAKARPRIIVSNLDDAHGAKFLELAREQKIGFKLGEFDYESNLLGDFNKLNILAVAKLCAALGIPDDKVRNAIKKFNGVDGRVEFVPNSLGIEVVVDYAHTPGSMEALYKAFVGQRIIGVFGSCGGGRDKWKRPEFGKIADRYCQHIILTNEDPYDEDPREIVREIEAGITNKSKYEVEMDRRAAISKALRLATSLAQGSNQHNVVLITGKGTDRFIHGPKSHNIPWSDTNVAKDEIQKLEVKPG